MAEPAISIATCRLKRLLCQRSHLVEVRELLVTQQSLLGGELPSTQQANHLPPVCYFSIFTGSAIRAALLCITVFVESSNWPSLRYKRG